HPVLKQTQAKAESLGISSDEDLVLDYIFTKVVNQWFADQTSQAPGYARQFESILPWKQNETERLKRTLTMRLIGLYKAYEDVALYGKQKADTVPPTLVATATRLEKDERRAVAMRNSIVDRLAGTKDKPGGKIANMIASAVQRLQLDATADARLEPPAYYVKIPPAAESGGPQPKSGETTSASRGASQATGWMGLLADVTGNRDRLNYPWETQYTLDFQTITKDRQRLLPGLTPDADDRKLLDKKDANGNPENEILAFKYTATADVFDAKKQKIASASPVPVLGYVIEPVPRPAQNVTVYVYGKVPPAGAAQPVRGEVRLGAQSQETTPDLWAKMPTRQAVARFYGIAPREYSITVKSLDPNFGPGSATVRVEDPYTEAAYQAGIEPKPVSIEVELPYVAKPPTKQVASSTPPALKPLRLPDNSPAGSGKGISPPQVLSLPEDSKNTPPNDGNLEANNNTPPPLIEKGPERLPEDLPGGPGANSCAPDSLQQQVEGLISQAIAAAGGGQASGQAIAALGVQQAGSWSAQQFATADALLTQAEQLAAPYPCLTVKVIAAQTQVGALKAAATSRVAKIAPPGLMQLPEDNASNQPRGNAPGSPVAIASGPPPGLMQLPEDNPSNQPTGRAPNSPAIGASANSQPSPTGNQGPAKPPGFWQQLGNAVGTAIAQAPTQNPPYPQYPQQPPPPPPQPQPQAPPPVNRSGGSPPPTAPTRTTPPATTPAPASSQNTQAWVYLHVRDYQCSGAERANPLPPGMSGATINIGPYSTVTGGGGAGNVYITGGTYSISVRYGNKQVSSVAVTPTGAYGRATGPTMNFAAGAPITFKPSPNFGLSWDYELVICLQ
ncbi:MAG: hypothetical protein JO299_08305, partial [Gammaproteobacteria bacterium]|nr:hypothetical protein [Gammaproteobacteria bacterium]